MANRTLVLEERAANTTSCFTQAKSLNDWATENHTQGNQTFVRNRSRTSDNKLETIQTDLARNNTEEFISETDVQVVIVE